MDLVAYLRISSESQLDGFGLPVQRKAVRAWAKSNGHRVAHEIIDSGVSGTRSAADRPGLSAALDMLRPPPRAQGLIVARLDRLARALTVQEAILAVAWRSDATVFTADGGEVLRDDPNDPMRTAIRQMQGVFAELERSLVTKRLRDGRQAKREAGSHAVGQHPYGRQPGGRGVDGVIDLDEQRVIDRITQLRGSGASYRAICSTLNSDGIRPRRAAVWSPAVVRRIAARTAE